jgi:hypothetical protein
MYNCIINGFRKALNISITEYVILDAIYHLANNTKYGGWAIISRQNLANQYDISKRSVINIINALEQKGLVIRNKETNYLRAGDVYCDMMQNKDKWIIASTSNETFISGKIEGVQNLHGGVQNLHGGGAKIAHNKYINNNNNNINNNTLVKTIEKPPSVSKFIPPTKQQVEEFFVSSGYRKEVGENAFNYYSIADWKDSKGKPVKNWKQKMQGNWFRDEHKIKETTTNKIQLLK